MKKNLVLALLAIPLVVFSTYSLKAQEVFSPYEEPDSAGLLDEFRRGDALQQRLVRVNWDILDSAYQRVSEGGDAELTLNLFPDESFPIVVNVLRQHEFQADRALLMGSSTEGEFGYTTENSRRGNAFISFIRPKEFTYYFVREVQDGVSQVLKFHQGSLFSRYRGGLTPDESQISGELHRLIHVNHEEIFSRLEDFSDGKREPIFFSLNTYEDSIRDNVGLLHGTITVAYIKSVAHTPVENSLGDYKVTLDIPSGSQNNTFDMNIVDGKVASMEISYTWAASRRRYEVIPFDEAEGVYIMTEEVIEGFAGNN